VRHHVTDIDTAASIFDMGGKPVFVAADVEHRKIAYGVRVWVCSPDIDDVDPMRTLRRPIPIVQRCLGVFVLIGEVAKGLATDDAHGSMFSKRECPVKRSLVGLVGRRSLVPLPIILRYVNFGEIGGHASPDRLSRPATPRMQAEALGPRWDSRYSSSSCCSSNSDIGNQKSLF
jgi:hypothetical protein